MSEHPAAEDLSLFASWRDPASGSIYPIGRLIRRGRGDAANYSFAYLKLAEQLHGFEPLPGLPDLHRRYESDRLFPVFANRVMPRSRPEFDLLATRVHLTSDADPFEVLARAGGRRATDRIEVFAAPSPSEDGQGCALFFVRGLRHVDGAAEAASTLRYGDQLALVDDPQNDYNTRAVILRVCDGRQLGWVPDYLVDFVHEMRQLNDADPVVAVEHLNEQSVPAHMRLLCRMTAPWPDGYVPFSGPEFQSLADLS